MFTLCTTSALFFLAIAGKLLCSHNETLASTNSGCQITFVEFTIVLLYFSITSTMGLESLALVAINNFSRLADRRLPICDHLYCRSQFLDIMHALIYWFSSIASQFFFGPIRPLIHFVFHWNLSFCSEANVKSFGVRFFLAVMVFVTSSPITVAAAVFCPRWSCLLLISLTLFSKLCVFIFSASPISTGHHPPHGLTPLPTMLFFVRNSVSPAAPLS